ncbi:hypothetical protein F4859DRAFT_387988 [Xylaria cf. heliscus]|nr:hypothetical protein F4859DRAFT_387988 [Xylaria cf. heliscus]
MKTTSLTPGIAKSIKIPKRNDERIILHFDYDCFYASVFENENPSLKSQPLGIKQKSILATCNYVARARGVKKLMLISEAQRICPELVLMNGEDLTRFRDVSKKLWAFLRAHAWNRRVERLGLDEVFLDVTDVVAYNRETLNVHALRDSFFHLDRRDPVKGFAFDGSRFSGCVAPSQAGVGGKANGAIGEADLDNPLCVRLMLASHLAGYLRHRLDEDFGYTSSGGISTNKLLAKLAGNVNKPNNQTTLLAVGGDGGDNDNDNDNDAVRTFMDAHSIRKVPGIGSRIAQSIEEYILSRPTERRARDATNVTVGEARTHPGMSAELLEQILDRPGAERGGGEKVWSLLHGVDPSEVKEASDVPTQISIEDTYMSRPLQTVAEVGRELRALATSLIRRMRVDLTETAMIADSCGSCSSLIVDAGRNVTITAQDTVAAAAVPAAAADPHRPSDAPPRWLAYPKTLRLSTRTKPKSSTNGISNISNNPSNTSIISSSASNGSSTSAAPPVEVPSFSRSSRSAPLPSFVFQVSAPHPPPHPNSPPHPHPPHHRHPHPSPSALFPPCEEIASRLVTESLLPLFRRLHPERNGGWNLALLNVCVTNMVLVASESSSSSMAPPGRDIGRMFRTQEGKLREWTVYDTSPLPPAPAPDRDIDRDRDRDREVVDDRVDGDRQRDDVATHQDEDMQRHAGIAMVTVTSSPLVDDGDDDDHDDDDDGVWDGREDSDTQRCHVCGHILPAFAMSAHERFHAMDE